MKCISMLVMHAGDTVKDQAGLAAALHCGKDGGEGLQPWQALGGAQVSPFEEVAFTSTVQHLTAPVPI